MSKYIYLKESDEVAGPVIMTKPHENDYTRTDGAGMKFIDIGSFRRDVEIFNSHIRSLPRKKTDGTHSWSDRQVLEEVKDFVFKRGILKEDGSIIVIENWSGEKDFAVATPIKSDSKEDMQSELEQAAKEYADNNYSKKEDDILKEVEYLEWLKYRAAFLAGADWRSNQQSKTNTHGNNSINSKRI